jgi:hypothetical protein
MEKLTKAQACSATTTLNTPSGRSKQMHPKKRQEKLSNMVTHVLGLSAHQATEEMEDIIPQEQSGTTTQAAVGQRDLGTEAFVSLTLEMVTGHCR